MHIKVLGYYLKSDGHAKMTLNEVIIANGLNLALNFILFKILGPHISSIALALVIGYLAGAVYISKYYFKKDSTFRLVSPRSLSIKDWFYFRSHALVASPELVGRVGIVVKTTVIISLCITYLVMWVFWHFWYTTMLKHCFILKMREYLDFCKSRMNRKLGVLLLTI